MNDALWCKLRCAGPVAGSFTEELGRFSLWLPTAIAPFLAAIQRWMALFGAEQRIGVRIELERRALCELETMVLPLPQRRFLAEFLRQAIAAHDKSLAARAAALRGETVPSEYDDLLVAGLHQWLRSHRQIAERTFALWLDRLLLAWQNERRANRL